MRIIGPPSATIDTVRAKIPATAHARFAVEMLPELWAAGLRYYVDSVGLVAQAFKETGGGNFGGNVPPGFFNPCGLKIRTPGILPGTDADNPLAHSMFASWAVGCRAHAQHVRAYTGWAVQGLIVDPRYVWVIGRHTATSWSELGGKWAPSSTYGVELEAIMTTLGSAA